LIKDVSKAVNLLLHYLQTVNQPADAIIWYRFNGLNQKQSPVDCVYLEITSLKTHFIIIKGRILNFVSHITVLDVLKLYTTPI